MSEPQTTDSTTDVMRYWVGLLRQLGEDVCTWMAVVDAMQRRIAELEGDDSPYEKMKAAFIARNVQYRELRAQAERDRAVIEAAQPLLQVLRNSSDESEEHRNRRIVTAAYRFLDAIDPDRAIRLRDEKVNGHE